MAELQYNFLDNNFTTYENVETPQIRKLLLPLGDIELSDKLYIGSNGKVLANNETQNNSTKMTVNNNEEYSPQTISNTTSNTTSNPVNPNGKEILNFFMSKGLSKHASAGIVANLMQESKLNPTIVGDNGTSFGIAQWRDPKKGKGRWTNLKNFSKNKGLDPNSLNAQLEFLWHELNTDFKNVLNGLNSALNHIQATTIFMKEFEKPNQKYANLSQRLKYAELLIT